jgi:hypothetical protein
LRFGRDCYSNNVTKTVGYSDSYRIPTISGNPGLFGGKTKNLYEPAFYFTLLLADRQVWIIGKNMGNSGMAYSDIDWSHGQSYG